MSRRTDKEDAANLQYETEHTEPPKSRSVVVYMAVLIVAAFLLLLLAYIMQVKTADTVKDLHQSANSFQTIDQLVEDNSLLREELSRLEEENAALSDKVAEQETTITQMDADNSALARDAENYQHQADALNVLHRLRVLYNNKQYDDARELLAAHPDTERALLDVVDGMTEEELEIYNPLTAYQRVAKSLGVDTQD